MAKNKKVKQIAGKAKRRTTHPLPQKQLEIPAGFHSDGSKPATLRDVLDPDVPTMQLTDLTLEQRAKLVAKRLELQPSIELAMVGAGMIDKTRAIKEVKKKTQVGKLLIEIEHQMIANLIEQAKKHDAKYGGAPQRQRK
ncbi:MAG TPA: hypothetical protein VGJ55_16290 [Pyrinomonadaceae bacterium]|jgi:hypothetical protein